MALTRKLLTALGIDANVIDQIIEAHTETVDALKKERDTYKAQAEQLPAVEKERDDYKAASEDNGVTYKAKYEKEHSDFEAYKQTVTAKESREKKERAYRALLKETGVSEKRLDAILKVTDLGKVELDDEGAIKGADELKKSVQTEWSDFIVTESTQGANTANPPKGKGESDGGKSRAAEIAAKFYKNTYGGKTE